MIPPLHPFLVAGGKLLSDDHLYSLRRRSGFIALFWLDWFGPHHQIQWGLETELDSLIIFTS